MRATRKWLFGTVGGLAIAGAFLAGRLWAAGIPATAALTYTGTLEDATGVPLTGERNIQVNFWSAATGGATPLCLSPAKAITLVAGRFSVVLPDTCTDAVKGNKDVWVEALVDGNSLGFSNLGAVPYAIEAGHATAADTATNAANSANAAHATNADNATNAANAATAGAAGGDLKASLTQMQAAIAALQAAPKPPVTLHGDGINLTDDPGSSWQGFAADCMRNGASGGNTVLHACTLAAQRKCSALGYQVGVFVGESDGNFLSILCIK